MLPQTTTLPQITGESFQMSTAQTWDCNGGVQTSQSDANTPANVTDFTYNDPLWRLTKISRPDGGSTSYSYSTGTTTPWTTSATTTVSSSQSFTTTTTFDGLGRSVSTETTDPNSSSGYNYQSTVFNNLGQIRYVYNPYFTTSDPTYGKTTYSYDALGRVTDRLDPANFNTFFSYNGRATEVQYYPSWVDKETIYQSDGLGRTVSVCEVTSAAENGTPASPTSCNLDITGTGFLTSYQYDVLNDLTTVTHPSGIQRVYGYDGLSRVTSTSDPEIGTNLNYSAVTYYTYDTQSAGDLYQRVAPLPNQPNACPPTTNCVTTTYLHDALHRLTSVQYSDGTTPWKTFAYDQTTNWGGTLYNGKGYLTGAFTCPSGTYGSVCGTTGNASVGEIFSYDPVGRVGFDEQCTPSTCGNYPFYFPYTYDYVGDMKTAQDGMPTNPITYTNTFNSIGQLNQVATNWLSSTESGNIVSGIQYNALGEPASDLLGNGIQESWTYGLDGSQATYNAGSVYNFNISSIVGGTYVLSANDSVNGNWSYGYDNFGRLISSGCSGACPFGNSTISYTYNYDVQGNRWKQTLTSQGSGDNISHSFGLWNHISDGSVAYDSAGNITNDGTYAYTYDPEGNLTQVNSGGATYVYDAFGRRVSQTDSSGTFEYLFDLQNHPITKLQSGSRVGGEVWFGRHFASNRGTADNFMLSDWLGAGRAWTDLNGSLTLECQTLPFGDSLYCWGSGNNFDDVFASLKYDFDYTLYDSQSRQYNPLQGRWTVPDPARLAAVDPTNPQTWNRYAYVTNNPLSFTDPTGLILSDCYSGDCGQDDNAGDGGGAGGDGTGGGNWLGGVGMGPCYPNNESGDSDHLIYTCVSYGGIPGFSSYPVGEGGGAANNGQTPRQAATKYCQQHGQLSFNIPFTKIPVTISLSATLGPANYSATNDINAVFPVIPWPEWLAAGAGVDVTVNAPAEPSSNPNVGLGKNLSVGYFTTPNGPQGLSLSVGPSIGPPINVSVPANNACGMLVGGKG
jgi:RHS repeat-associated protein